MKVFICLSLFVACVSASGLIAAPAVGQCLRSNSRANRNEFVRFYTTNLLLVVNSSRCRRVDRNLELLENSGCCRQLRLRLR